MRRQGEITAAEALHRALTDRHVHSVTMLSSSPSSSARRSRLLEDACGWLFAWLFAWLFDPAMRLLEDACGWLFDPAMRLAAYAPWSIARNGHEGA